jgi:hypothetical protein
MPNGRNIFQQAIEYTNLSHSKALHNFTQIGSLGLKYNIWQLVARKKSCRTQLQNRSEFLLA